VKADAERQTLCEDEGRREYRAVDEEQKVAMNGRRHTAATLRSRATGDLRHAWIRGLNRRRNGGSLRR
jgi:hypothetical protein